jgi:hypothetical protein
MCWPMLVLAFGVAIFDEHTRLANLETSASLLAAFGATVVRHPHTNAGWS